MNGPLGMLVRGGVLWALLAVPAQAQRAGGGGGAEDAFLRGAAEYFQISEEEAFVLSRWKLDHEEIPVVLFLAGRGGVSPDVVVAQRRNRTPWLDIARSLGVGAGDFYVDAGPQPGRLTEVMAQFSDRPAAQWNQIRVSDVDAVALVNVRFLSRHFERPPSEVVTAWTRLGSFVQVYRTLARRSAGDG